MHGPTHTTFHCLSLFKWSRKETTSCPRITHYVLTAVLVVKIFFLFQANLSKSQEGELIKEYFFEDDYPHLFASYTSSSAGKITMCYELPL